MDAIKKKMLYLKEDKDKAEERAEAAEQKQKDIQAEKDAVSVSMIYRVF